MKMSGSLFSLVTSERKRGLMLFVLMIFPMMVGTLSAQRMIAHRGTVKDAYNFWFYVPPVIAPPDSAVVPPLVIDSIRGEEGDLMEAMVRKPLVIFLHGASLRGNNLSQVRRYGTLDALSKGLNLDAYVLAPQHPTGGWQPDRVQEIPDATLPVTLTFPDVRDDISGIRIYYHDAASHRESTLPGFNPGLISLSARTEEGQTDVTATALLASRYVYLDKSGGEEQILQLERSLSETGVMAGTGAFDLDQPPLISSSGVDVHTGCVSPGCYDGPTL